MIGTSQVVRLSIVNYIVCIHESLKSLITVQWDKGMHRPVCVFVCVRAPKSIRVCVLCKSTCGLFARPPHQASLEGREKAERFK